MCVAYLLFQWCVVFFPFSLVAFMLTMGVEEKVRFPSELHRQQNTNVSHFLSLVSFTFQVEMHSTSCFRLFMGVLHMLWMHHVIPMRKSAFSSLLPSSFVCCVYFLLSCLIGSRHHVCVCVSIGLIELHSHTLGIIYLYTHTKSVYENKQSVTKLPRSHSHLILGHQQWHFQLWK